MAQEAIAFVNSQGASEPGVADVVRFSDVGRITTGVLWMVGGVLGGTVCLVVPVVHLVSTWALPLGGILMGIRTLKRRIVLYTPEGTCPTCGQHLQLSSGSIDDPSWQACPHCKAPLKIALANAPAAREPSENRSSADADGAQAASPDGQASWLPSPSDGAAQPTKQR